MKCPPYHWHGRRMPTDNRSESVDYVRTTGTVKAQFPCIFARVIETPWYTGECRASCLSCSATLSKQFPRFHSNYTANVVFQGQDMHAFFIHHHKQARNERKSFRRYRSSWLKKCMWVSRGIALYPQNGGQAAVVDAWAVHGIWWIACANRITVTYTTACMCKHVDSLFSALILL